MINKEELKRKPSYIKIMSSDERNVAHIRRIKSVYIYIHEYSCLRRTCMVYISLCYFMCVVRYQYLLINLPRECLISDSNLIPILSDCLTFTLYTVHWFAGYFYLVGSGPIYDHLFRYNNLRRVTYSLISNCSSSYTCTLSVGKVFSFKCQFSTKILYLFEFHHAHRYRM